MGISIINLLLIAVSLGVDSFSIALSIGAFFSTITKKEIIKLTVSFMSAHFLMLLIGWFFGVYTADFIEMFAHWIILVFIGFVGVKLIYEAVKGNDELEIKLHFWRYRNILFLSFITSLDALAIGFSFALLNTFIIIPNIVITIVVGIMTLIGIFAGGKLSEKFPNKMKIIAGIILILIGIFQVLEHYFSIDI